MFRELQLRQISLNFKTAYCNLKIRGLGAKLWLFYYFNFERNYDVLTSKSPCILLNKNINFNNNKKNRIENGKSHTVLKRRTLCFSLYENRKLKDCDELELAKEKREHFLYRLFCLKGIQDLCFISMYKCTEYTFRIYILLHIKNISSYTFVTCF